MIRPATRFGAGLTSSHGPDCHTPSADTSRIPIAFAEDNMPLDANGREYQLTQIVRQAGRAGPGGLPELYVVDEIDRSGAIMLRPLFRRTLAAWRSPWEYEIIDYPSNQCGHITFPNCICRTRPFEAE